ncbi:hypothetical protein [Bradyrhizobium tropiciagri]|uniref:hypothetical protein n=1 Tax=Bradyrhizobium tropiciagri TaxID=312253 RepID=UPI00067D0141|nr:hypothetical protein [Bradyrhizobium tropiciagri]
MIGMDGRSQIRNQVSAGAGLQGRAAAFSDPPGGLSRKSGTISKTDCAAPVDLFRAEKIATVPDRSLHDCRFCGVKLTLVRTIMESESGVVIHTFECERCGDRTWTD